jgi:hypothetical protein
MRQGGNMQNHWMLLLYSKLLRLFPAQYQDEYSDELLYAVRMLLAKAQAGGRTQVLQLAWRELRDLPRAWLKAHWRERRSMLKKLLPGAHLPDGPFEFWQVVGAVVPLVVPLLGVVLDISGGRIFSGLICGIEVVLLLLLTFVWIEGLMKAFPVWTLPSLGLVLFCLAYGFYLFFQVVTLIVLRPLWGGFWPDSILLRLLMYVWFNLVYVVITAVLLMILLLISKRLLQLARKDWSLLSFALFNLTIPYIILSKDEFHGMEPYYLVSILILITGAVLFMVLPARWSRLVVLLAATFFALGNVSVGLYRVFPDQSFAAPDFSFRMWEALQPVLDLPALLIILCLPVFVGRLPASFGDKQVITTA